MRSLFTVHCLLTPQVFTALKSRLADWFIRPRARESGVIVLAQRRVYILPTRHGMVFAIVLLMMLLGAINYGLSLGFVLTFLLVAMAFNGMLYTFRNLVRLQVTVPTHAATLPDSGQNLCDNGSNEMSSLSAPRLSASSSPKRPA